MKILLTGAAGFVGWKTAELLCQRGDSVVGVDNLNDYYEVELKHWRLQQLAGFDNFQFIEADMKDTWADITKARDLLDWQPEVSFEDGMQALVDWHLGQEA